MSASQDKVQGILETVLQQSLPLIHKGIFTPQELQGWMCERQKMQNNMLKPTFKLSDYLKAIEFEYSLERVRRNRVQELALTNPLFKKQSKTDFIIVKRIIKLWDRTMHKFKYNVDLWKQYLDFCIKTNSKNQFYKALSNALRFLPFCEDLWLIGVYYQIEVGLNLWKARKIFIKSLRSNQKKVRLWVEMVKFQIKFLKVLYERQKAIEGEQIVNFIIHANPNDQQASDIQMKNQAQQQQDDQNNKLSKLKLQQHDEIIVLIYEQAISKIDEKDKKLLRETFITILSQAIKQQKTKNVAVILKRALKKIQEFSMAGTEIKLMKKQWQNNTEEAPKNCSASQKQQYYEQYLSENPELPTTEIDKIICQFQTKPAQLCKLFTFMFQTNPQYYMNYVLSTKKFKPYNFPSHAISTILGYITQQPQKKQFQSFHKTLMTNLNPNKYIESLELLHRLIILNKRNKNYKANNDIHRSIGILCRGRPEVVERCVAWIHGKEQE